LKSLVVIFLFACSIAANADTIRGAVQNNTTRKPAAGDEVQLKRIGQGMEDVGTTKTNAKGEFHFDVPPSQRPYVILVKHQDVTYTHVVRPGASGEIVVQVFNAAPNVKEINIAEHVMVLQTGKDNLLKVDELFTVINASNPPRTLSGPHTFELYLPEGAVIADAGAQSAGGMPLKSALVPQGEKNKFAFLYPIRPGETQFKVGYSLPYIGKLQITPRLVSGADSMLVVTPLSMNFTAADTSVYQPTSDPQLKNVNLYAVKNAKPQQQLGFEIAGTGEMPRDEQASAVPQGGQGRPEDNRPGGGMGVPNEKPDPLHSGQWLFLGVLTLFLTAGAVFVYISTPKAQAVAGATTAQKAQGAPSLLMEAMKEEVFQLESERIQGKISPPDYQLAKAALDRTLQRAVQRESVAGSK